MIKAIFKHKFITAIILILIIVGGYFGYQGLTKKSDTIQYATTIVQKGTIVVSVSGSGQVSSVDQADIKSKASGDVVQLLVKEGQAVGWGQVIARIDTTDINKQIADAQWNLQQQQISYDNAVLSASRALSDAYNSGYSSVSTSFFNLSGYMQDLKDVLGTDQSATEYISGYRMILGSESIFIKNLLDDYSPALSNFNDKFVFFRQVYKNSDSDTVYKLISDTIDTAKLISQALESARHMHDAIALADYGSLNIASHINTMKPKIDSDVSSIYSNINSLQNIKDTIDDANRNNPNNIAVAENNLRAKKDALTDLQKTLGDYTVVSPFAGVISKLNIKNGDSISSSATIATMVTKQNIAEISLNEVDAAKVKVGQKATATFDAIDGLTLTGKVAKIDTVGTVSQGVVSYNAQIIFDTQDDRVKSGMSVSVAIIVDMKDNVILAPNSAIKTLNGSSAVQILQNNIPVSVPVETGLSDDTMTEIVSGLQEGESIVSRTITSSATSTSSSAARTSTFGIPGISGGAVRQIGR